VARHFSTPASNLTPPFASVCQPKRRSLSSSFHLGHRSRMHGLEWLMVEICILIFSRYLLLNFSKEKRVYNDIMAQARAPCTAQPRGFARVCRQGARPSHAVASAHEPCRQGRALRSAAQPQPLIRRSEACWLRWKVRPKNTVNWFNVKEKHYFFAEKVRRRRRVELQRHLGPVYCTCNRLRSPGR
jgi:hypothetical protein